MGTCSSSPKDNLAIALDNYHRGNTNKRARSINQLEQIILQSSETLTAEETDIIYRIFEEGCRDSFDAIRLASIQGFSAFARQRSLPVVKIDNSIEIIVDKANDSIDNIVEAAIICLGYLAENRMIPAYSVNQIYLLLIRKVDDRIKRIQVKAWTSLFSMAKSDTIPSTYSSRFINVLCDKLSSTNDNHVWLVLMNILCSLSDHNVIPHLSLPKVIDLMLFMANNPDNSIRCDSIHVLSNILTRNQIPANNLKETITLITERISDSHVETRAYALLCLAVAIDRNYVRSSQAIELFRIIQSLLQDSNHKVQCNTMLCISKCAQYGFIPSTEFLSILNEMISKSEHQSDDIRSGAMSTISNLTKSNSIPNDKIQSLLSFCIKKCTDKNSIVRGNTFLIISRMLHSHHIQENQIPMIIEHLISNTNDKDDIVRSYVYGTITKLCEYYTLPNDKIQTTIEIMLSNVQDRSPKIRYYSIGTISKLAQNNLIPLYLILSVLNVIIKTCDDIFQDASYMSILTLSYIIHHETVLSSTDHLQIILDMILRHCSNQDDNIRSATLSLLSKFADENIISNHKLPEVIRIVFQLCHDSYHVARNNALWTIGSLCKNQLIPKSYHKELFDIIKKSLSQNNDISSRLSVCMIICHYSRYTSCHEHLITLCIHILLSLIDDTIWKYRAIEGLCILIEIDKYGDYFDQINDIICTAYQQGDEFYSKDIKQTGKKKISDKIETAYMKLSAIKTIHNRSFRLNKGNRLRSNSIRTMIKEVVNDQVGGAVNAVSSVVTAAVNASNDMVDKTNQSFQNLATTIIKESSFRLNALQNIPITNSYEMPLPEAPVKRRKSVDAVGILTKLSTAVEILSNKDATDIELKKAYELLKDISVNPSVNLLSNENIKSLIYWILQGCESTNMKIRSESLESVISMIDKHNLISDDLIDRVTSIMITSADLSDYQVIDNSLQCLLILCRSSLIPSSKLSSLISVVLSRSHHRREGIRYHCINILSVLAQNNKIPLSNIMQILDVLCSAIDDNYQNTQTLAITTLKYLASYDSIPSSRVGMVTDRIKSIMNDSNEETWNYCQQLLEALTANHKKFNSSNINEGFDDDVIELDLYDNYQDFAAID